MHKTLSLDQISAILGGYRAKRLPGDRFMKRAAVAAILREHTKEKFPELLFIRRADHPNDPWSGHMAFPGGRVDPEDTDEYTTALRETKEEIGFDLLKKAALIGRLSHVLAKAHGKPLPLAISPFVFSLKEEAKVMINHEVQEVIWVPLHFLANKKNRQSLQRKFAGVSYTLPCYHYQKKIIWGLTLQMVDELISCLSE